jgi:hypothetical protein
MSFAMSFAMSVSTPFRVNAIVIGSFYSFGLSLLAPSVNGEIGSQLKKNIKQELL